MRNTLTAVELDPKTDQPTGRRRFYCSPNCMGADEVFENQQETFTTDVLSDVECAVCGKLVAKPEWPKWVTAYDHNRAYGGPEEGGWWYDTGEVLDTIPCINDEQVEEAKSRLTMLYGHMFQGNHDIGSVLCEGELQITVEDKKGEDYPKVRPHYE